jgi:hypothetical protein
MAAVLCPWNGETFDAPGSTRWLHSYQSGGAVAAVVGILEPVHRDIRAAQPCGDVVDTLALHHRDIPIQKRPV